MPQGEIQSLNARDFVLTLTSRSEITGYHPAASGSKHVMSRLCPLNDETNAWANFATPSNGGLTLGSSSDGRYGA